MQAKIFISHSSDDISRVNAIATQLKEGQLQVIVDAEKLSTGRSFITFMEDALRKCDYCLLLWSAAASTSKWVRTEWEAAFHRTVELSQSFLVIARLEDHAVPELLRPRLRVDLFPEPRQGVNKLISMFQQDQQAAIRSARRVISPAVPVIEDVDGKTIYISSQAWGKTFPLRCSLNAPVAVIIVQVQLMLDLPMELLHDQKMGVRFNYEIVYNEAILDPSQSLSKQDIQENQLLWLQTTMRLVSNSQEIPADKKKISFRGGSEATLIGNAQRELLKTIRKAGLE